MAINWSVVDPELPYKVGMSYDTGRQMALKDLFNQQAMQLQGNQLEKSSLEMGVMRDNLARQKRIRDALMAAGQPQQNAQGGASYGGAANTVAMQLHRNADIYEREGDFDTAMKLREHAEKLSPKFKADSGFAINPQTGKVEMWATSDKSGVPQFVGVAPKPDTEFLDLGGKRVAVDKMAVTPGSEWAKTQSPDSVASNAVTMRGQNMADARARDANAIAQGKSGREDADQLRKEFSSLPEVKNYKDVVPIINAAISAPNTPAGDFALIYGVGKILDPGSVVREGEMGLVIKSGSPAERVKGYLSYLQGNGRLTPALRNELNSMLAGRVGEMKASYDQSRSTYEGIVKKRGYATEDVFQGIPEVKSIPTNANRGAAVPVKSEADALKLPAGTRFQLPDGRTGTAR